MKRMLYSLALLLIVTMTGCQDLAVDNENSPDRVKALAEPADVQSLGSNTFTQNWERQWCGESMLLSTMADANSSSWANWGMRDMSSEPRIAWNNDPSYGRRGSTEGPWFSSYGAISDANDVLVSLAGNAEAFAADGIDTERLRAFAKFNQAWAHSFLAQMFDRAFIVDETTDLELVALGTIELNLSSYEEVMAAAIQQMEAAIAIAQANDFTITAAEDWVYGLDFTSADMVAVGNSMIAQWLGTVARTPEERAAVDWNQVINRISSGITTDFAPIGDDDGNVREWDCQKFYFSNGTTWSRIDYRTLGPADESGGFQNWVATPLQDRLVFDVFSSDRRIIGGDGSDPTVGGLYTEYQGNNGPFPAARGTYHYSSHNHFRWVDYNAANANGPMPYILVTEMELMHAEALLRTGGDLGLVAQLINNTRVNVGQLSPATAEDPVGSPSDDPSKEDDASLWSKLKYEFNLETLSTSAGLQFFTDRGWGDLVSNTPYHFPIPGAELETLGLQLYTFGGGGEGSAAKTGRAAYDRIAPAKNLSVD